MATYTSKFNLKKPATGDGLLVADINNNMDTIDAEINNQRPLLITISSVSSLPVTYSNEKITSSMVCVRMSLSNTIAQGSDWTVSTSTGAVTVDGTILGTTTIGLWLMKPQT